MVDARPQLQLLADVLRVSAGRDECHDPIIHGKRGNVHVDGTGYSVAIMLTTARQWTTTKKKLSQFCSLRQDGDTEGVVFLPKLPTRRQATILRKIIGLRKRPNYSPEVLEAKREALKKAIHVPTNRILTAVETTISKREASQASFSLKPLAGAGNPLERQSVAAPSAPGPLCLRSPT